MLDFLVISAGAIAGAYSRFLLTRCVARVDGSTFPYGTLVINILGSLLAGFFLLWAAQRMVVDPRWRLFVIVGFCGAFTTFSGYSLESVVYFEQGKWMLLALNVISSNVLCLAAALGGMALARVL